MSLPALKARERVEEAPFQEYWIGEIERCAGGWMFVVIDPDDEIETFVHVSREAAESARAAQFRTCCPAVPIVCAA